MPEDWKTPHPRRPVGHLNDASGHSVSIATDRDGVLIRRGGKDILLGPAERDEFMQLLSRAIWTAQAWAAEHTAAFPENPVTAEILCGFPGECVSGPEGHLWADACRNSGATEVPF